MYEYKFASLEFVLKSFTPAQIRQLVSLMDKRHKNDMKRQIVVQHTDNPSRLIDALEEQDDIPEEELEEW